MPESNQRGQAPPAAPRSARRIVNLSLLAWSAGNGLAVAGFLLLVELVLTPIDQRGWGQPLTSFLIGLGIAVEIPGYVAARMAGLDPGLHPGPRAMAAIVLFDALLATVLTAGWIVLWRWTAPRPPARAAVARPRRLVTRRRFLCAGAATVATGAVGATGYALVVEPRWLEITRHRLLLPGLPSSLGGLRVVHLTDIHHGPWFALSSVRHVVDAVNGLGPDLVLLNGDYVSHAPNYIKPVATALAGLRPRIGSVAVLGNHDWWEDGPLMRQELRQAGIAVIDNARVFVSAGGAIVPEGSDGLCLAGVGDHHEDVQDYDAALAGVPAGMPRLLLSHNPDVAEDPRFLGCGHRVDLMLAGHTHGGQIRVPGLRLSTGSRYGMRYAAGWARGPVCPVYTCRGVGTSIFPLRINCRPEIAVFELERG